MSSKKKKKGKYIHSCIVQSGNHDRHSTSISVCEVWEPKAGVQVSRREFHTYIYLNYPRIEFLSCIKNNNNKVVIHIYIYIYIFLFFFKVACQTSYILYILAMPL